MRGWGAGRWLEVCARWPSLDELRHRVTLYNLDAAALIKTGLKSVPRETLVYLDPPYYVKGKGLYEDHYAHEDHAAVATAVRGLSLPWIVSYDNVPEIRLLYGGFRSRTFGLRYSAQTRYEGSEVMFFSDRLEIPDKVVPSRAAAA